MNALGDAGRGGGVPNHPRNVGSMLKNNPQSEEFFPLRNQMHGSKFLKHLSGDFTQQAQAVHQL